MEMRRSTHLRVYVVRRSAVQTLVFRVVQLIFPGRIMQWNCQVDEVVWRAYGASTLSKSLAVRFLGEKFVKCCHGLNFYWIQIIKHLFLHLFTRWHRGWSFVAKCWMPLKANVLLDPSRTSSTRCWRSASQRCSTSQTGKTRVFRCACAVKTARSKQLLLNPDRFSV